MDALTGKHTACPMCGGKDRFRFDDKGGSGSYFCNNCGAGTGIDLIMGIQKVDFKEARRLVLEHVTGAPVEIKRAADTSKRGEELYEKVWKVCHPLNGFDAASLYLRKRGIIMDELPTMLRFHPSVVFHHDDGARTKHPAMIALVVGPDRSSMTLHYTYLTDDGEKAAVPKVKKLAAAKFPAGGAVRLAPSAATTGIAEGIETALGAHLLDGIPVWAACTAGALTKWEPPEGVEHVIIYGDNDKSYTGQATAYALAHRLTSEGYGVTVRIPFEAGTDWLDEWLVSMSAQREAAQ
jgi:putative DNA primase/helicase